MTTKKYSKHQIIPICRPIQRKLLGLALFIIAIGCVEEIDDSALSNAAAHERDASGGELDDNAEDTGLSWEMPGTNASVDVFNTDLDTTRTADDNEDGWHALVIPDVSLSTIVGTAYEEETDPVLLKDDDPELEGMLASPYKIGNDNRTKVKDTMKWPYSTVVKIYAYFWEEDPAVYRACTGTLISDDVVLTAAHCVYDTKIAYGYPYSVRVAPGAYLDGAGNEQIPFGAVYCSKTRVPKKYQLKEKDDLGRVPYDYGVLRLKSKLPDAGERCYDVMPSPMGASANMLAYHNDISRGGTMTESSDKVRKVFDDDNTFNHYIDADKKSSGAAITGDGDWENVIFGLNVSQRKTESGNTYNVGLLITAEVYDDIATWSE